jgi:glutamate synthase (NADPH/NADH)
MAAREGSMKSEKFARELSTIYPVIESGGSDSAAYDNVLELLMVNGTVTLPEAVMMVRLLSDLTCVDDP